MKVVPIESPSGLIRKPVDRRDTLENKELRIALEQAVDVAGLNLTERLAINKKFFPNGDGFKIVPPNADVLELTTFYKKGQYEEDDFAKEATRIAYRSGAEIIEEKVKPSRKSNYQTNLDNALAKLYGVFKNSR